MDSARASKINCHEEFDYKRAFCIGQTHNTDNRYINLYSDLFNHGLLVPENKSNCVWSDKTEDNYIRLWLGVCI